MSYTYSICHPEQQEIEYVSEVISKDDVLRVANDYPWNQKLNLMESMDEENIFFNPALDFTCEDDRYSFCLTATRNEQKKLEFSLWFNRKVQYKSMFGLFGKKEKMQVVDQRGFQKSDAIDYLKIFVDQDYQELEALMSI